VRITARLVDVPTAPRGRRQVGWLEEVFDLQIVSSASFRPPASKRRTGNQRGWACETSNLDAFRAASERA
jgi:hypothetical protein